MKIQNSLLIILLIFITSCNPSEKKSEMIEGVLIHSVYFWLNNPESEDDKKVFEKAIKRLISTNKLAVKKHLGKPGNTAKRDVIDNSYDYCMILTFPSLEAQRLYQDDPTHLIFIDQAKHLWKKVRVYDSIKEPI